MSNNTGSQAKQVFIDAVELEGRERSALLDQARVGRPELRERVEALLDAHDRSDLGQPLGLPPNDLEAGERVGPYRLIERLGEGGFGVVWRAEQEGAIRRDVALKVIKLGMDTAKVVRRFDAERQTLADMDHPCIAQVFDAGAIGQGRPYFAMELVRGVSITEHCTEARAGLDERLRLFVAVCQAVQHAHQKGVIHRDLKPSNILVARHDGVATPMVIDFGIAKATRAELVQQTLLTEQDQFVGSPAYMAPEQMQLGSQDIDTRADVYSLGVVLYELLTGSPPFDVKALARGGYAEIFRTIREQDPLRPSTRVARDTGEEPWTFELPATRLARVLQQDLDWIVLKALEKERSRRYESVGALAADVRHFLANEPVEASPPSALYRLRKTARRHRITVLTLGAVSLALALGAGLAIVSFLEARDQELVAKEARALAEEETVHAEEQRDRANAVVGLLQRMLNSPGEDRAKGPDYPVRSLLADFARGLEDELAGQPRVEATIRSTIGNTYLVLDMPAEARPQLVRARALKHELLDAGHSDRLMADIDFARLLSQEARFDEAEPLLESALAFARESTPPGHPDRAAMLSAMSLLYDRQGRHAESFELALEALEVRRAALGPDHPELASTLYNIGRALEEQARFDEAEGYLREALRIVLLHDAVALYRPRVYSDLALVREGQGAFADALELMARSYATSLAVEDPATAALARQRAAEIAERVEDPLAAAEALLAGDMFEEAEPRAFEALESAESDGDLRRAQVLAARVMVHAGVFEEAEGMLLEVWEAPGESSSRRAAGQGLLELYAAWDELEELEAWRARLEDD